MAKGNRVSALRQAKANNSGTTLTMSEKTKITNDIASHSSSENDRVENFYKTNIAKEENIVLNVNDYIKSGVIKSANDDWFQQHLKSYNTLKAQYSYFKRERKRQGK